MSQDCHRTMAFRLESGYAGVGSGPMLCQLGSASGPAQLNPEEGTRPRQEGTFGVRHSALLPCPALPLGSGTRPSSRWCRTLLKTCCTRSEWQRWRVCRQHESTGAYRAYRDIWRHTRAITRMMVRVWVHSNHQDFRKLVQHPHMFRPPCMAHMRSGPLNMAHIMH